MSAIARLLLALGEEVSGSDLHGNGLFEKMRQGGACLRVGHRARHIRGADRVIYSSSVSAGNPELKEARNQGLPVFHRGQMIASLLKDKKIVAVTGAHGKSTTTALSASLLVRAGLDPTVLLGAEVETLGGNARLGRGRYAVIEADDSDASLLWLEPRVAIVTNVDEEHLDYFRNRGEILETYGAFLARVADGGAVIGCADDPGVMALLKVCGLRAVTYGLSRTARFHARAIESRPGGSRFLCFESGRSLGRMELKIPGLHNVVNALAAAALGRLLGIEIRRIQETLAAFTGAKRRFEIQGEVDGILVVEDYAHHPAEIRSTLQAARTWKERRIRCVFQPHRYSRTRHLFDPFCQALALADQVALVPIYAASEEPLEGIASDKLVQGIQAQGGRAAFFQEPEELFARWTADARPGDLFLFMGAGSIGGWAGRFLTALRERRGT